MSKRNRKNTEKEKLPEYVQGAKFLKLGLDVEPENWPREPKRYAPSEKFRWRFRQFSEMADGNAVEDAIKYGGLYSALQGAVAFINDLGGVAFYVICGREPTPTNQERLRKEEITLMDLYNDDYNYMLLSLWPYVYDYDKAWGSGRWSTKQLERIQHLANEDPEEKIDFLNEKE